MKVHFCEQPRCHKIIPFDQQYCSVHAPLHQKFRNINHKQRLKMYKKYNAEKRDPIANAFYQSKEWKSIRHSVMVRNYHSSAITGMVIPDKELIVDHVVPRRLCKNPLDVNNLWCLSRGEHTIKTRIEESIAARPNGDEKLKHLKKFWWKKIILEKLKNKN